MWRVTVIDCLFLVMFSFLKIVGRGGILSGHFKLSLNAKPILLTQTNLGALATKIEG